VIGLLFLALGIILTVVAGASLDWYPARIGGPAYWLDDHLYQPVLAILTPKSNWLALAGFLFLVALGLSFVGYALCAGWASRKGQGERRHLLLIVGVQLAMSIWLGLQPYLSSQDIFSYAFYTHIFVWYRDNPYVAVPRDYPFDPLFSAIFWKDQPSNYGPLWTYLSSLAPLLAGSRVGPTILILKALAIIPAVATTPLLWSTLERLRPRSRVLGTLLYAWNPLLLIETAEAGHNDIVMVFLLVVSLWFWCRGKRTASMSALVLAVLVKYIAAMLIPLYLIAWWKGDGASPWRILPRTTAIGLILTVAAYLPIYAGPATFSVVQFGSNSLAYTNSPLELVFREVRLLLGESPDLTDLPLHYDGHWIGTRPSAILWSVPDEQRGIGIALPMGTPLLVVEPEASSWVHVYEPKLGRFGFIRSSLIHDIPVPPSSVVPGTTAAVLAGVSQDPDAQKANALVRLLSVAVFLPWYLRSLVQVARGAADPITLPRVVASIFVVYLLAVQSWFWPWYVIWVIPFAAIVPESPASMIALLMTLTTSLLNAQPSVNPPPFLEWLYGTRVILIYGLPLLVAFLWHRLRAQQGARPMRWVTMVQSRVRGIVSRLLKTRDSLRSGLSVVVLYRLLGIASDSRSFRPHTVILARLALIGVPVLLLTLLVVLVDPASGQRSAHQPAVIEWQRAYDDALRLYSAGDYEAAIDRLTMVLSVMPRERPVLQLRVAANLQLGRYERTIPDLTTLVDGDPKNVELRLERGIMFANVQRSDHALRDFRFVITMAPNDPDGYEWAGLVNFERGDLGIASRQLEQALAIAPGNARIARELANVLASDDHLSSALALYDAAIRLDPIDARTYADRAALLRHLGSPDATIPDLRKVLVLSGDVQQQRWAVRLLGSLTSPDNRLDGRTS
jgi:lipoprotein NlpI